jgi:hypothetical protein
MPSTGSKDIMNINKTTPVEIIGEEIFFNGDKVEVREATPLLVKLVGDEPVIDEEMIDSLIVDRLTATMFELDRLSGRIGQLEKELEMRETVDEIIAENTHRKYTIFPFDYWRTLSATDRRNIAVYLRVIAATVESPALADESRITT